MSTGTNARSSPLPLIAATQGADGRATAARAPPAPRTSLCFIGELSIGRTAYLRAQKVPRAKRSRLAWPIRADPHSQLGSNLHLGWRVRLRRRLAGCPRVS